MGKLVNKSRKYGEDSAIDVEDDLADEVNQTGAKEAQQDVLLLVKNSRDKCSAEGTNWKFSLRACACKQCRDLRCAATLPPARPARPTMVPEKVIEGRNER